MRCLPGTISTSLVSAELEFCHDAEPEDFLAAKPIRGWVALPSSSATLAWEGELVPPNEVLVPPNEVPAPPLSAPWAAKRKYQPLRH